MEEKLWVTALLILASEIVIGQREVATVHWPPDGSLVSARSVAAAGIRCEFSGMAERADYRSSISVFVGNTSIASEIPYDIENTRKWPTSSPSRFLNEVLWWSGDPSHERGEGARWLVPFSRAFRWDNASAVDEDGSESACGECLDGEIEAETVTFIVRLYRRVRGSPGARMEVAAQSTVSWRLISSWRDWYCLFGGDGNDMGSLHDEARSERILVNFVEPGQSITSTALARSGFTAVIQGLHPQSQYSVHLLLNESVISSDVLTPGDSGTEVARGPGSDGWGGNINLLTGRERVFHAHLPELPIGLHAARLEVRVGGGTRPVALHDLELDVVAGDDDEAIGFVKQIDAEWVQDFLWCNRSKSNLLTCTPKGYRPKGRGVPDNMEGPKSICKALVSAGVSSIHVFGDSFARHLFVSLAIITTGDFEFGALDKNESTRSECCGEAQFEERSCRLRLAQQVVVCQGKVDIEYYGNAIVVPYFNLGKGDLIIVCDGRHQPSPLADWRVQGGASWLLPRWIPAKSPWEGDHACMRNDFDAIKNRVRDIFLMRDGSGSGGNSNPASTEAPIVFVNWHTSPNVSPRVSVDLS